MFYQVWDRPLYTVGGGQIISDALEVCGARNVFADLTLPAPQVSIEAVLQRNPEVILASDQAQLDAWKAWPQVAAVAQGQLLLVTDKGLERPSGQMIEATAKLCQVDRARPLRPRCCHREQARSHMGSVDVHKIHCGSELARDEASPDTTNFRSELRRPGHPKHPRPTFLAIPILTAVMAVQRPAITLVQQVIDLQLKLDLTIQLPTAAQPQQRIPAQRLLIVLIVIAAAHRLPAGAEP